ncbi:hypothetical protein ABZP36_033087 [Zizania latifolia]
MVHGPAAATAGPSSSVVSSSVPRSPWQSPVPYLFGGLAAMLGLIALSLLALACSYWQLAGSSDGGGGGQAGEESRADGEKDSAAGGAGAAGAWRGHVVVIMAGDEQPTFLATPASTRATDAVEPAADVAVNCGASCSTEGKTAECEASTRPVAGSEDGAPPQVQSPTEQTSSSSVALALQLTN